MTDAQSEIAMELEQAAAKPITPQQARAMALAQLHRAEAEREAVRANEARCEVCCERHEVLGKYTVVED